MTLNPPPGFRIKRVYDDPTPEDGTRILVDRLWPRGVSKQRAHIDEWDTGITPSNELRHWFHEDPSARYHDFEHRFRAELDAPTAQAALARLRTRAQAGPVTLVTAVRDLEHSHIPVLLEELCG
ncbi:DUF488 domain-containing protein [Nocardia australiensis]|uniref:DUF488 domain-containing protein n=1 Tax=Nocardia australiensis TaxID=2887191 RepID=UPI001D15B7F4|nr:DUF488 family protein [Nocardia australiensis]